MQVEITGPELDLETTQAIDEQHVGNEKITELYNFSRTLVTTNALDVLLESIVRFAIEIVQVDLCRILMVTPEQTFSCQASQFLHAEDRKVIHDPPYALRVYAQVAQRNSPQVISRDQDSLSMDEGRMLRHYAAANLCLVPMRVNGEMVGLLVLSDQDTHPSVFHDGKVRLANLIACQSASAIHRARLSDYVQSTHLESVLALAKVIDVRDPSTGWHGKTLVHYSEGMAEKLGCSMAEVQAIGLAALLHDIGKIGVPDAILRKNGPLTDVEWGIMRRHPDMGADIVLSISKLSEVAAIIRSHHERVDGNGYPQGLKGDWILLGARILAVADAYDAITSGRVYRARRSHQEAVQEIQRCSGEQFDPKVVEAFIQVLRDEEKGILG